jgi:hypothetical protein
VLAHELSRKDQSQSDFRDPRDTYATETLKVPVFDLYPATFRPLTLDLIKRVFGMPLANEISELRAQSERLNNHYLVSLRIF